MGIRKMLKTLSGLMWHKSPTHGIDFASLLHKRDKERAKLTKAQRTYEEIQILQAQELSAMEARHAKQHEEHQMQLEIARRELSEAESACTAKVVVMTKVA